MIPETADERAAPARVSGSSSDVGFFSKTWIHVYFAVIGIGYLFPFSAMTQPVDYWSLLFPDFNILFYISIVFMYTNMVLLVWLVLGTQKNSNSSFKLRISGGFIGQLISLLAVPIATYFLHLPEGVNFYVVLACTGFMALATAFLDSSVIALSGCFPVEFQESLQLGVGLSTLIGSVYRVFTKLGFEQTQEGIITSSLVYFYTGVATLIVCLIAFGVLLNSPMAKKYLKDGSDEELLDFDEVSISGVDDTDSPKALYKQESEPLLNQDNEDEFVGLTRMQVLRYSFKTGISVSILFLTTLAIWPALIASIPTFENEELLGKTHWWPLILLNLFAVGDVIGRFSLSGFGCFCGRRSAPDDEASKKKKGRLGATRSNILYYVLARFIALGPLVVILAFKGLTPSLASVFHHDIVSVIVVGLLGWSNGWLGSLTIILMNEPEDFVKFKGTDGQVCVAKLTPEHRRFIGTLTSLFLNGGLVIGATVGMAIEVGILKE